VANTEHEISNIDNSINLMIAGPGKL